MDIPYRIHTHAIGKSRLLGFLGVRLSKSK